MKSARRRAREFAVQALYQWQLSAQDPTTIAEQYGETKGFDKIDREFFLDVLNGAVRDAAALREAIKPHLDRSFDSLSPIERGVLLLAVYEFKHRPDVPFLVVINEAVELAKTFGGTDGYKYVNGVLDKLAPQLRAAEIRIRAQRPGPPNPES
jgi:transcription antitermination protein NusB